MTTAPATHGFTVPARELAAALDAVRFAVGSDPEAPVLSGVLFDLDGGVLRLVATDRYRMALAELPVPSAAGGSAPSVAVIVPTALADGVRALLGAGAEEAELTLGAGRFGVATGGHRIAGATLDHDYPDYRSLVRLDPVHRVGLAAAELRGAVESGATRTLPSGPHGAACEVTVLALDGDGRLTVVADDDAAEPASGGVRVAVNRDFLLDALPAGGPEQLVLEVGGPIAPLAIRTPGRDGTFSLLMPIRVPERG